jgi:hypothetical protein
MQIDDDIWCESFYEDMLKNHEIRDVTIVREDNSSFQCTNYLLEIYKWKLVGRIYLDVKALGLGSIDIDLARAKSLSSLQLWCAMNGYDYKLGEDAKAAMEKDEDEHTNASRNRKARPTDDCPEQV